MSGLINLDFVRRNLNNQDKNNWFKKLKEVLCDPFESFVTRLVSAYTHFRQPIPVLLLWKDITLISR